MKKEEALKTINESTSEEFVVRTPDEETTFLANFKEQEVEKEIKPHIGRLHTMYEADFKSVTGLDKPEGVKGYNWIKDEVTKLKTSADKLSQSEVKLEALEKQLKEGKVDEAAKLKIDELTGEVKRLEKLHKTAKQEWEQGVEKERTEFRNTRIKSELNHAMMGYKFLPKEIIADEVREPFVNQVLSDLVKIADFNDEGKLIFRDAEKNVMRNKETTAVVTASELLSARMKPILDNGKQQPGLGGEKGGKGKDVDPQTDIDIPVTVDTLPKLTAYLRKNYPELSSSSKEYQAAFQKYSKDLKMA